MLQSVWGRLLYTRIPYSRKLSREKTFCNWWKIRFSWRKLLRIARFCFAKRCHAPNFAEKTFAYSHKTAKFVKVFSLESFYTVFIMEKKMIAVCSLDVCGSYVPGTFFPLAVCPHTIINPFFLSDITHKRKYTRKKKESRHLLALLFERAVRMLHC